MAVQNSSFSVQIKIFTALQLSRILPFFLFILAYNKGGLIDLIYKSETRGAGGIPIMSNIPQCVDNSNLKEYFHGNLMPKGRYEFSTNFLNIGLNQYGMASLASMETDDPKKTVCKCLTLARVLQTYQVSPCNVHQYGSSTLNSLRWGANILTCVFNSPCASHNAKISEYMECQKGDPSPTCF